MYPYAFIHICVINIQNMALSMSHEGNSLCVYHPSALKIATLCDSKSWSCMRKRTRIRAYGSVPYTFLNFYFCVVYAFEVSIHRACCERASRPYSLGGGGTNYPGSRPADVTTRSPRMFTHSLDVN